MQSTEKARPEHPETLIITKILHGETELFEILMRRYNELLYRTIRSYLTLETDVEDTMQDTYIKAFEKLYQFKHEAKFSTWLIRIGINEALQRKRKTPSARITSINQEERILQIEDQNIMGPERNTMYKESSYFMEKAIDTLPEKYKIIFMLKEVEGIELSEISKSLDLSYSNVKVRLHRARAMLRDTILTMTDHPNIFDFGNSKCDQLVVNVLVHICGTFSETHKNIDA